MCGTRDVLLSTSDGEFGRKSSRGPEVRPRLPDSSQAPRGAGEVLRRGPQRPSVLLVVRAVYNYPDDRGRAGAYTAELLHRQTRIEAVTGVIDRVYI